MEYRIRKTARGCTEPIKGKPGSYRLYFSLGKDPETGRYLRSPKRTYHCRSKNPKNWPRELDHALMEYRQELEGATETKRTNRSLAGYADEFHALSGERLKSPLSMARQAIYIRHIHEMFGSASLAAIKPDDIRRAYDKARANGMSSAELYGTHVKLRQIMQSAVENEIIDRNPCIPVKLAKPTYRERKPLTAKEASRFLSCLLQEKPSSKVTGTMLLLQCGMRRGEMLGLSWDDFDPAGHTLRIERQFSNDASLRPPKSKMSRRTIAINDDLVRYLDDWKHRQREDLAVLGLDQTGDTPIVNGISVVNTDDGKRCVASRIDGHNFDRWFRDFCADNGFGEYENVKKAFVRDGKYCTRGDCYVGLTPHALRHTQATLLIGEGADVKTVQARLGHASPSTTLSIYSHAIEANDRRAADAFGRLISG